MSVREIIDRFIIFFTLIIILIVFKDFREVLFYTIWKIAENITTYSG